MTTLFKSQMRQVMSDAWRNSPGNGRKFLREPKKSLVTSEIESANEAKDSTVLLSESKR